MKRLGFFIVLCSLVFLATTYVFAAKAKAGKSAVSVSANRVLQGDIIDNMCANSNEANLGAFVKTHTKACALMPACKASGYSIYTTDGKLIPISKSSDKMVVNFLNQKDSVLQITVNGKTEGKNFKISSITNRK
ncbi:MAG: hypothetical protein NT145_08660 [Elusimicrobia bacterium]|nr:hypothetical protein [Elusimicrobiota bacterium]